MKKILIPDHFDRPFSTVSPDCILRSGSFRDTREHCGNWKVRKNPVQTCTKRTKEDFNQFHHIGRKYFFWTEKSRIVLQISKETEVEALANSIYKIFFKPLVAID